MESATSGPEASISGSPPGPPPGGRPNPGASAAASSSRPAASLGDSKIERHGEIDEQPRTGRSTVGNDLERPRQQVHGCRQVASFQRGRGRTSRAACRSLRERARTVVGRARAPPGTGGPARGGSRRSRRTPRTGRPPRARATRRSAGAGPPGSASASSRTRRRGPGCGRTGTRPLPRTATAPAGSAPCAAASAGSPPTPARASSGESSVTAPQKKTWPTTDGALDHRPFLVPRRSSRAVISAWIVPGRGHAREVAVGDPRAVVAPEHAVVDQHAQHLLDEQRVALGGVGDATRISAGSPPAPSRFRMKSSLVARGSSGDSVTIVPARSHSGRSSRSSGRAMQSRSTGCAAAEARDVLDRSRSVGSAQWMSSNTATSGPFARRGSRAAGGWPRRSPGSRRSHRRARSRRPADRRTSAASSSPSASELRDLAERRPRRSPVVDAGGLPDHLGHAART